MITAPGLQNPQANNLLAPSGGAYVLFGNSSYPSDLDLSKLNQTGGPNGYRIYGPAAANVASAAPVGDMNGDQIPDILLGGNNAAWVIAGKSDTNDVYLNDSYNGYQMTAPDGTYGPAEVAGLGDMDGDGAPDTLISFPSANNGAGTSFLAYGRPDMTNLSLANVDGSQAAQITGTGTGQAGTSADGVDGDRAGDSNAAAIIGDPGNAEATVASSPHLKAYKTHWGKQKISCEASPSWTYPYPAPNGRTLPPCRVGRYKLVPDHSLKKNHPYNPGVSAFGAGNAHKKTYDLKMTDANGKSVSMWPIVDSLGNPVAYIKRDVSGCFTIYDGNKTALGDTAVIGTGFPSKCPDPGTNPPMSNAMAMYISFIGRGCMATDALESEYVGFELVQTGNKGTGQAKFEGLQGYISKDALPPNLTYAPGSDLWQAFAGCGPGDFKFTPQRSAIRGLADDQNDLTGEDFPGTTATFSDGTTEFFRSSIPTQDIGLPLSRNQGLSGVLPNEGFLFISSSAVQTGDVVRAMVPKSTPFTELDYMTYSDPNDYVGSVNDPDGNNVVGNCRIAQWVFGKVQLGSRTLFGWIPHRNPVPSGCAPGNP